MLLYSAREKNSALWSSLRATGSIAFCRDLPGELTLSAGALSCQEGVPQGTVLCYGGAADNLGAAGLVVMHGCWSSIPCTLWYWLAVGWLRFLRAVGTLSHNASRGDIPQKKAELHRRKKQWPCPEHCSLLPLKNRFINTSTCQDGSGTVSEVAAVSERAVFEQSI